MDNNREIFEIEKKVTELKFSERDLIRQREIIRLKALDKAEKSDIVNRIISGFSELLINSEKKDLVINSIASKYSGRDNDEFISEVKVEIRFRPSPGSCSYNELTLTVYLNEGFDDETVRGSEKNIKDTLNSLNNKINELKEMKKMLKLKTEG